MDLIQHTIHAALGIEIVKLEQDQVVLSMPVGPNTRQPMGYLHGGASVVLAESAASIGTMLNINQETEAAFGIEINANHLRSKKDGIVYATATPVHKGKTMMVWQIDITDEENKKVCVSRCTVAIVAKR
ncbi:hotdog fold thioesterase [Tepidibacillus infernus]|uniref:Esterase n=1 Tax=Tepidibacillus decaturensis TaxID=1413211 RepID=A0A135L5C0_9BACI|nr:hotdog fold thioesterase [Tepidibacillus decaturensis]KXG44130.1 esterase [Tepidibacillus decaturensis]